MPLSTATVRDMLRQQRATRTTAQPLKKKAPAATTGVRA